jgi:large subunit ribosomal protein L9
MKVLLLEKIKKLGNIGDLVVVKDGYARNYLFTRKKALRFTKENQERFEVEKEIIEKANAEKNKLAAKDSKKISGKTLVFIRQAGDDGKLYGSVTNKDIASTLKSEFSVGISVENIIINEKIKEIGFHDIVVELHAEVDAKLRLIVARSIEEAKNTLDNEKKQAQEAQEKNTDDKKVGSKAEAALENDIEQN